MTIKILQGDCLQTLSSLEEKSVNTCVTSPPYWGLRDYGTGEWEGGDPDCNHVKSENKHGGQRSDRNHRLSICHLEDSQLSGQPSRKTEP